MVSSLLRFGGVALRETGEQVLKRLSKESDHIGDAIRAQARPFTEAIVKEMDEAPYKIPDWEFLYRNDLPGVQKNGMELMQDASNKQSADHLKEIVGKNKPQLPAEAPKYPAKWDVKDDQAGFDEVHDNLSAWLKEEQQRVGGNVKDIDRKRFAPEGIFIGGEERNISGITEHLKSGSRIKLNKLGLRL